MEDTTVPRGIPKKQSGDPKRAQADGTGISKMDAVRRALFELGKEAKPLEIQKFIKSRFGVSMDPNMISTYKSTVNKKSAATSGLTQKPKTQAAPFRTAGPARASLPQLSHHI